MNKQKMTVVACAACALLAVGAYARPHGGWHGGGYRHHYAPHHYHGGWHHHGYGYHHGWGVAAGVVGLAAGTAAIVHDIVHPAPVVVTQPTVVAPAPVVVQPTPVVAPAPVVVTQPATYW